jgi:hypothetical protein
LELQSVNRRIIISKGGNPWLAGVGAVLKDKKATHAQLVDTMGFGKEKLYFHS